MKKNGKITFMLISGLALAIAGGCGRNSHGKQMQMPVPEVAVMELHPEKTALTAELAGRTSAYLVAEVRPQVGGIIQKRFFEEGSDVKAGDVLYQIDPSLYQAAYDKAKADLARAEAHVIPLKLKFDRYSALIKSKAVSEQSFDDAKGDYQKAEADVGVAKAAAETARINLNYTRINAPISGRIGKSHVTVGALVTANHAIPLATIQQIDPIYVDVTQSSSNLLRLKQEVSKGVVKSDGMRKTRVKLFFEDNTPYAHDGELQFSDVTVDQSTGSFILRIVFPNPDYLLLPGMFVRAKVKEGTVEQAILVPQQSVMRDMKGHPFAMIVDKDNKVEQRTLEIDRAVGNRWLVKKGLIAGDRVIMEGFQKIRPGAPVKAVPFDENGVQKTEAPKKQGGPS